SERVRQFAAAIVRVSTYTADLAHLSARAALDQFRLAQRQGVLYLDGGWQTLAERARSLGVEIHRDQPVENLRGLDASGVILAVPPRADYGHCAASAAAGQGGDSRSRAAHFTGGRRAVRAGCRSSAVLLAAFGGGKTGARWRGAGSRREISG